MRLCNTALSEIIVAICCFSLLCPLPLLASGLQNGMQDGVQLDYPSTYQLPQNYLMAESATEMRDRICPTCNPDKDTPPSATDIEPVAIPEKEECGNTGLILLGAVTVAAISHHNNPPAPSESPDNFFVKLFGGIMEGATRFVVGITGLVVVKMAFDDLTCKDESTAHLNPEPSEISWQPVLTPKYSGLQMNYQW